MIVRTVSFMGKAKRTADLAPRVSRRDNRMAKLRDSIDRRMAHIADQTQKLAAEIDELAGMGK